MRGKFAEELTWKAVEAEFKKERIVIVPLGAGCKEHGMHLPMNTDKILANYFAKQLAEKLPVLVMPTITYHYFPAFLNYAGSTSLDVETSRSILTTICEQWHKQGAKAFYILNFGVSTNKPLKAAQQQLSELGIIMKFTDLLEFDKKLDDIKEQKGGTHADEIETSMMLYIKPEVVSMENAKEDFENKSGKLTPFLDDNDPTAVYSPTGVWGNPTLANANKGKIIVERFLEYLSQDIKSTSLNYDIDQ